MINNQRNNNEEKPGQDRGSNLTNSEMANTNNAFLGQMGHAHEGKTESFQGNWAGNYGSGSQNSPGDEVVGANFISQAGDTGNGLTSAEDDLLASGQNVDDLGLGNAMGSSSGKEGETAQRRSDGGATKGTPEQPRTDTSEQGSIMPDPEDTTDQNEAADQERVDDIMGDEGPGLATFGDVASMTGQNIDDLGLPSDEDVAGWRQDGGTIGQDSDDKDVVDNGRINSVSETSGEFTTGKADKEGGWARYPNSGDLGQVDPGQQNYVDDQDTSNAFRAGDFKTTPQSDSEEGSEKYTRQRSTPLNPGSSTNQDQEDA